MRLLILGGDGMLGHQLLKYCRGAHDTCVTLRRPLQEYFEQHFERELLLKRLERWMQELAAERRCGS
ncbi:MAG: hypothetical protein A3G24_20290 [Betaproteobacteria bacterium RIFCSPLOWO2_12_FULL_62_13]|nr:MAG: hypothetical protein A3G24_20290 [Betaproteobacteria bacterium RIFCSPLOWO2_12_FULL_62_13]